MAIPPPQWIGARRDSIKRLRARSQVGLRRGESGAHLLGVDDGDGV
jgi:hypothetical protein